MLKKRRAESMTWKKVFHFMLDKNADWLNNHRMTKKDQRLQCQFTLEMSEFIKQQAELNCCSQAHIVRQIILAAMKKGQV
jgi:hypothetical protein